MSFLSKLKFWKKDEDEPLGPMPEGLPAETAGLGAGGDPTMPGLGQEPKMPEQPRFEEPTAAPQHLRDYQPTMPSQQPQPQVQPHQIEIIDSKLDAIKAILSALEQRLANLERMAGNEKRRW